MVTLGVGVPVQEASHGCWVGEIAADIAALGKLMSDSVQTYSNSDEGR